MRIDCIFVYFVELFSQNNTVCIFANKTKQHILLFIQSIYMRKKYKLTGRLTNDYSLYLTLDALNKTVVDGILFFITIIFQRNKTWYFT